MNRLASIVASLERVTAPELYGVERIPECGALFVGNHTLFGVIDVPFMEAQLWRRRGIRLRGLGDHGHYRIPVWRNLLERSGMVRGTRENVRALMRDGQHILVFPGFSCRAACGPWTRALGSSGCRHRYRHTRCRWRRAASGYSPAGMKVAYVFSTSGHTASYKLGKMILPQLEQGTHGVEVVGIFFFDDNTYLLRAGDPVGERRASGRRARNGSCSVTSARWSAAWPRGRSARRCRRERSWACGSAASPTSTRRWRTTRRTTSSRCERTELVLGGLRSTEPRLGEPWPPIARSDGDGLGLGAVGLAGRLAHRRADTRERQANCFPRGGALLD